MGGQPVFGLKHHILTWADGHNPVGINKLVGIIVMAFDVIDICSRTNSVHLIKLPYSDLYVIIKPIYNDIYITVNFTYNDLYVTIKS